MKNYQKTINDEQDSEELSPLAYIDTWEPHIVKKKTVGTVHWLNRSEPDESFIMTGVWKHILEDDSNNEFYFRYGNNDMMFYVLEGEAEYSKTIPIRKGEWKTFTPFAKLFIQINSSQKHDYPDGLSFRTLKTAGVITRVKRPGNHHRII